MLSGSKPCRSFCPMMGMTDDAEVERSRLVGQQATNGVDQSPEISHARAVMIQLGTIMEDDIIEHGVLAQAIGTVLTLAQMNPV